MYKIYCLVVVKNESDLIYETIIAASKWAYKIIIMDNMSTDETWNIIKKLESELTNIIIWGQYGGKFNDGLRQIIYNDYKSLANEGDWWCRLDGDEFYIDDPRSFINDLPHNVDHIYNASFQYYFTQHDYDYEVSNKPLQKAHERLKWYKCNHSEIRFVKHRNNLCWPQNFGWPCNIINPSEKRIRLKHYQYRSLSQIKSRLSLRSIENIGDVFKHEIVDINSWYLRRGFNIPSDIEYQKHRIVDMKDLNDSENYYYLDSSLPPIITATWKKKIKFIIINFYMRFFNKYLFNL